VGKLVLATGPLRVRGAIEERRVELEKLLGAQLGCELAIEPCADYAALEARVHDGSAALAWVPPVLAVRAVDAGVALLLAELVRGPGAHFFGTLFVKASAPQMRVEELRGTRVAWVGLDSCSGYLFPRQGLVLRGLDPSGFFAHEAFCGSHAEVVRRVASGEADVGATFFNMDGARSDSGAISAGWYDASDTPMRPVMTTDPIPSDALCASVHLAPELRTRALAVLLGVTADPRGKAALEAIFAAERFAPARELPYAAVRAAMRL
jgi:phosphonate transport system substrate-binding protein